MQRLATGLALALTVAACAHAPERPDALAVRLGAVARTPFQMGAEYSGSVVAARSVTVGSAVAGRVIAVDVRVGDRVRAGDAIARIDAAQFRAEYAQAAGGAAAAGASAGAAQAQLAAAQTRLHLAGVTAARMHSLYVQGAISRQDEDQSQTDLAAAQAAVVQSQAMAAAAQSSASAANAGVTAAGVPLEEAAVRAPFDGVITARLVEPGAVVGAGGQIAVLQNERDLEVDVTVPDAVAAALAAGAPIAVRVDELGDTTLGGRIRALVPNPDPALRASLVKIAIAPHPGLIVGMFARVNLAGNRIATLSIPLAALVTRAGQSGAFAYRNERAEFVPLQTGTFGKERVAVAGNLRSGERVITSPLERVTDGAAVTPSAP